MNITKKDKTTQHIKRIIGEPLEELIKVVDNQARVITILIIWVIALTLIVAYLLKEHLTS